MPAQPSSLLAAKTPKPSGLSARLRGTQSLVHILGYCWSRPSLLLIELTWRWLYGAPALLLMYYEGAKLFGVDPACRDGSLRLLSARYRPCHGDHRECLGGADPPALSSAVVARSAGGPGMAVASGVGRSFVLRRYDPALPFRPLALSALQALRVVALGGSFVGWFKAIEWSANTTLAGG